MLKKENTDKIISDFFNKKHDYLIGCANNILKLIQRKDLKNELVTDCYLYLIDNKEKLDGKIQNGEIESICVRYMTMQVKWSNTSFKKDWVYPNKYITAKALEDVESYAIIEEEITEEDYLKKEKEIQDKFNFLSFRFENDELDKKMLYNYVFSLGFNTSGKLAKHTGLSRTGCYYLIKRLKESIKNEYTKIIK